MKKKREPLRGDEIEGGGLWRVGMMLEAEMGSPEYPNYWSTFHPVRVLEVQKDRYGGLFTYKCKLNAFEGEVDVWQEHELHTPRGPDLGVEWQPGDDVHILIRNRKIEGIYGQVDGLAGDGGIWVKGTVKKNCGDMVIVQHAAWNKEAGF
jgi:hypothetical protein